jgi:hypothetical protein
LIADERRAVRAAEIFHVDLVVHVDARVVPRDRRIVDSHGIFSASADREHASGSELEHLGLLARVNDELVLRLRGRRLGDEVRHAGSMCARDAGRVAEVLADNAKWDDATQVLNDVPS